MKVRSDCLFYILVGSFSCLGLASIVKSPTNQTTCIGASASFDCVISDLSTIFWLINGQDPGVWGVTSPATVPLFPGAKSTLTLPGSLLFSGRSIVCSNGGINSIPVFLTIQGPSSLPNITSIPLNSTATSISWVFEHVTSSALNYQVEIKNSSGLLVYNQSLSGTQLVYTIPDPCDRYNATVTAIYGYPNLTCTQRGSVQLVGVYPSAPLALPKMFLECSLSAQGLFNVNITILPQQEVCSYNISITSSGSQPVSYPAQKPIVLNKNQLTLNVSLPFNLLVNLTVIASNSYGSNTSSIIYSTREIFDVVINATSLPGPWRAVCSFISCSQSIGCLVFLNDTYCTASKRYASSSSTITCPMPYNDSLPGPGVYSIKAYAVLSIGSYVDSLYTGFTELKNEETPTKATMSQQTDIPAVVSAVSGIIINIIIIIIIAAVIRMKHRHSSRMLIPRASISMEHRRNTPFHYAARSGNAEVVDALLMAGSKVDEKDKFGYTALMMASCEGRVECVELLLDKDASAHHFDKSGQTALMKASSGGYVECVKLLLENGADVNHKDWNGQTALMIASFKNCHECVRLLLEKDADVNIQDKDGLSPLHMASQEGHLDLVKALIEAGANINQANKDRLSPLHMASQEGHLDVVKALIEAGANINQANKGGETPLHHAAESGNAEVVNALLEAGSKVDEKNKGGETPLHHAARFGNAEMVHALLKAGSKADEKDEIGMTPLHYATMRTNAEVDNAEMVHALLTDVSKVDETNQMGMTPLLYAAAQGKAEVVNALLKAGSKFDQKNKGGKTPLHLAAISGNAEVVNTFLEAGSKVDEKDKDGVTALMIASRKGHVECVKLLLDKGASADLLDKDGVTALMTASREGRVECVKLLLDKGASADLLDKDGNTALHLAAKKGHGPCVELLLSVQGIDANLVNHKGQTPLMLTTDDEIKTMLQKHTTLV